MDSEQGLQGRLNHHAGASDGCAGFLARTKNPALKRRTGFGSRLFFDC